MGTKGFLSDDVIFLAPLSEEQRHSEAYLDWLNDREVTKYLESGRRPMTMENLVSYLEGAYSPDSDVVFLGIFPIDLPTHIGNISLNINPLHRTGSIGVMIGDKNYWGRGIATRAITLMTKYGFQELGLHKLWAGSYSENIASIKAFHKAGYTTEATLRSEMFLDGDWHDKTLVSIIEPKYLALELLTTYRESTQWSKVQ